MHLITVALLLTTTTTTRADLEAVLQEVRHASFPELEHLTLTTGTLTSSSVFFQSNFDLVVAAGGVLSLNIDVNERLLDDPPSLAALRAVLAHELAHSLDYQQRFARSPWELAGLLPVLFWPPVEEEVERRADVVAVVRGFGRGLLEYRVWLYAHLDAEAVREKRRVYYSPLELALLTMLIERCPAVGPTAIARPPATARAIVALSPSCF